MKEEIFVLSVSGWECYCPVWFRARRTKDDFKRIVREAIHNCLPKLTAKEEDFGHSFIGGHEMQRTIIPILEKEGFEVITPKLEIDLMGECYYYKGRNDKPDIISVEDWKTITDHNTKVQDRLYEPIKIELGMELPKDKDYGKRRAKIIILCNKKRLQMGLLRGFRRRRSKKK